MIDALLDGETQLLEPVDMIFFGAHPDDIELSCGGTIAKAVKDGLRVGIIELTRGELGTRGTPKVRRREALKPPASSARVFASSSTSAMATCAPAATRSCRSSRSSAGAVRT